MKKLLALFLAFLLVLSCTYVFAFAAGEEDAPALKKDLVILYTSDTHCSVDQGWGFAGLYAVKESLAKDKHVLLVDDGDAIQGEPVGTMTRGEAIINIMNAVGYDIAIPGNHEFDYGMDQFFALAKKAKFPYISCNFNREGELVFEPYVIKEIDGVKIAFVGVTTPMTLRASTPRYFMDDNNQFIYGFFQDETGESLYQAVQQSVDQARAEGARYVIVMSHLGNEAECSPWMYSDVIANTTGIDALLDGHSHDSEQVVMKNREGKDVVRAACGTKLENIGLLTITTDGKISSELYAWGSSMAAPALLDLNNAGSKAVDSATRELNKKLTQVVASTAVDLVTDDPAVTTDNGSPLRIIRSAETNLGDLCADAYLDQAGDADIAFIGGGAIRAAIFKGDVTLNDILMVHPFGNTLTVIEVTGQQVLDALEWSVHEVPGEFGGFCQVAGLTFAFDPNIPTPCVQDEAAFFDHVDESMERRVQNVLVDGKPLDPEKTYKLTSNDYLLLSKGDGYSMFDGAPVLQEEVKLDNQVLIDYITGTLNGQIGAGYEDPYGQGRIVALDSSR
ncbi:MAG: bifunctional metallophosphatase/5'-nucleotidase [Oscillospiraceae bacterium]|nr:bifunctional metallophosphatase/5'-nucleotidase [Oscillospiraceae bacterium]